MTEATGTIALNERVIREALAGYAVAAEVIEQQRVEQLRKMTPQESWAIFAVLLERGRDFLGDCASLEVFKAARIENLLFVRGVFERLARSQGLL